MPTIPTDTIVFLNISSLTVCSPAAIGWVYLGPSSSSDYPLVVTNIGVNQGGASRREYPLVPRQASTAVNMTLSDIDPSLGMFNWPKVNVTQGQYRLDIYTPAGVMSSNTFAVNGTDVSCLAASSRSSIPPSSTPSPSHSTSSTSSSANNSSVTSPTSVVGGSSVNKGAIAGGVVGGVVVFALVALALWTFRCRKARARNATPASSMPKTKGQGRKGLRNTSDSMGALLPLGGGNQESSPQLSEENFYSEKPVVASDDAESNFPTPIPPARSYSKSSTSSRRPASMTVRPSYGSRETLQSQPPRPICRSLDSDAVPPSDTVIPPSSSLSQYPPSRTRRSLRKPVPVYDPSEFPASGSNDIPLVGRSEASLGGGAKMYYIIPDPPLEQRN